MAAFHHHRRFIHARVKPWGAASYRGTYVADGVELVVGRERRVARHEEVQPRRRDQRRHQADQVVVHVRGVPGANGQTLLRTIRDCIVTKHAYLQLS